MGGRSLSNPATAAVCTDGLAMPAAAAVGTLAVLMPRTSASNVATARFSGLDVVREPAFVRHRQAR